MKKLKKVTDVKQLKAGWYIRAVINPYGKYWIECIKVKGVPYNSTSVYAEKGTRLIANDTKENPMSNYVAAEWHLSTLTADLSPYLRVPTSDQLKTVLYPFSNKAWNTLKQFKDVFSFAEYTNDRTFTRIEKIGFSMDWDRSKEMDHSWFSWK